MANTKRLRLINDERILWLVVGNKACDTTATDYGCVKGRDYASCTKNAIDHFCGTDIAACTNGAEDYCEYETDTLGCSSAYADRKN